MEFKERYEKILMELEEVFQRLNYEDVEKFFVGFRPVFDVVVVYLLFGRR